MKNGTKNAIQIAEAYRMANGGTMPMLVITHTALGDGRVYIGTFRNHKKYIVDDQKMFCSIMQMAFALNDIVSYEAIVNPEFETEVAQMTKNVLAVVSVKETGEKTVEWFEDETLTPTFSTMTVEGLFTQLLPDPQTRQNIKNLHPKVIFDIQNYLDACTFVVPEIQENVAPLEMTGFEALIATYAA